MVAGAAAFAAVGPRAAAALAAAGVAADAHVGMPLSLHFARAVPADALAAVACEGFADNLPVEGVVVGYADADGAADRADGVCAFVPLQPLPTGVRVEVRWELPASLDDGAPGAGVVPFVFTVR